LTIQLVGIVHPDFESYRRTKDTIKEIILWRPEFDFQNREILTETINEICNSKLNISNISTKDASKEIQNFVVTIFDHYRNAIMYMEGLAELTEEILKEQKRLWDHTDILSDLRKRESGAKGRVRKFLETIDNLDSVSSLHFIVNDSLKLMLETLIPLQAIDSNTMVDFCTEEQKQVYFKTMQVKYTEGMTNSNVLGKGVKESTYVYFMRTMLQNRLMNRINFVKGNIRLTLVDEMKQAWKKSINSLSSKMINYKEALSPEFVTSPDHDPLQDDQNEKFMKDMYYGMDGLVKALDDDKKTHIYGVHSYVNRRGPADFSRSKSTYSKNDWRNKVGKLNPTFATYYLLRYQFGIRNNLAALEPYLYSMTHYENLKKVKKSKIQPTELHIGRMFESVLNMKDIYSMNGAAVQRLLQYKILQKAEFEEAQKRGMMLGDSKFVYEYSSLLKTLLEKNLICNSLQWTSFVVECIHDVDKLIPNTTVANTLVTSIGVYLDPSLPAETPITDSNQVLITSVDNNEIILGSENESIVRRMILQLLLDHCNEINTDLLAELKSLKSDIARRFQHQTGRKV
jgi:hypothetical protein